MAESAILIAIDIMRVIGFAVSKMTTSAEIFTSGTLPDQEYTHPDQNKRGNQSNVTRLHHFPRQITHGTIRKVKFAAPLTPVLRREIFRVVKTGDTTASQS